MDKSRRIEEWTKIDCEDELYDTFQPSRFTSCYTCTTPPDSTEWNGTDTKQRWEQILQGKAETRYPVDLSPLIEYYSANPVEYFFNKQGFRDEDFDLKPNNVDVYLGCSHTSGIGLHREHIWSSIVAKELDFPNINAALGGSGITTQLRAFKWLLSKFKIRNLFHFFPLSHARWEWYDSYSPSIYSCWFPSAEQINHVLGDDHNITLMNFTFIKAIKQICFENKVNYVYLYSNPIPPYSNVKSSETFARDALHFGKRIHKDLAKIFLEKNNKSLF